MNESSFFLSSNIYSVLNIEVYEDGWSEVTHIITNINSEFINVSIAKDAEFLLVLDFSEEPLDYKLNDGKITIYSENLTGIKVIYYSQSFTSKNTEGVWAFNLLTDANETNIILPAYSTMLGFEETPAKIKMENNKISLSFNSKKISFYYIIEPPVISETKITHATTQTKPSETLKTYLKTETQFITQTISNKTTVITSLIMHTFIETIKETITKTETIFGLNIFYIIILLIIIAIIVIIFLLKRRRETMSEYLTEEEEAIMNILKKRDGIYQSELIEILNLPKTTVWRHLKRLERMGKIKIIRKENKNYIILK
jgi:uncharacterized membrane protein